MPGLVPSSFDGLTGAELDLLLAAALVPSVPGVDLEVLHLKRVHECAGATIPRQTQRSSRRRPVLAVRLMPTSA